MTHHDLPGIRRACPLASGRPSPRLLSASALFLATGFAWPSAIHNATHDTRHALGLPCH